LAQGEGPLKIRERAAGREGRERNAKDAKEQPEGCLWDAGVLDGRESFASFAAGTRIHSEEPPMLDLAQLQSRLAPLFPGLMGVKLVEVTPDRVVAEMVVRPDLCTAGGILHGGASMAFADALGAVGTIVNLPPGKMTTTTDSSTKFMAGAKVGTTVRGVSVPLHKGRTTQVWQTSITGDTGRLCAQVTQTQLVMDARA
jgi:1,4-dihydroxy-2-naphthoyl-CoA hydrolase